VDESEGAPPTLNVDVVALRLAFLLRNTRPSGKWPIARKPLANHTNATSLSLSLSLFCCFLADFSNLFASLHIQDMQQIVFGTTNHDVLVVRLALQTDALVIIRTISRAKTDE
jgi:hypothetical protein